MGSLLFSPGSSGAQGFVCALQDSVSPALRKLWDKGFPWGSSGKESTSNAGDLGSIPRLGRSPGEGKGYPLQYSGLENSMDYTVHGVTKSHTWLSDFTFTLTWKMCNQIPLASKFKFPGGFSVPLLDPQVRKSVVGPRTFLTVQESLWYNCSAVCGSSAWQLYGGANGDLLREGLCHTLGDPGLQWTESLSPWQATADLCLCRRHANTQRQVWLRCDYTKA